MTRFSPHQLRNALAHGMPVGSLDGWSPPVDRDGADPAYRRLRRDFARLRRDVLTARLALFRTHVGETVATVSPLLLRLCELEGLDVDDLARRLRPGAPWESWLCGPSLERASMLAHYSRILPVPPQVSDARLWLARFAEAGLVIRDVAQAQVDGRLAFGVRVLGSGLEVAVFLGPHRVRTTGGTGALTLAMEMPEVLQLGVAETPLDRLVSHPLLDGAGAVITSVDESSRCGVKVRFELTPVARRMPWARDPGRPRVDPLLRRIRMQGKS